MLVLWQVNAVNKDFVWRSLVETKFPVDCVTVIELYIHPTVGMAEDLGLRETVNCTVTNKINGTMQRCLLAHFEATLFFIRREFTYP